jgi:biopolymer transport protein ExbD
MGTPAAARVSNGQHEEARMALSVGRPRGGSIAEINVTPMADVMIVLLIIFMVATPIVSTAPVPLPTAVHPAEHKGETLKLTLRVNGAVVIDGVPLADSVSLSEYLAARASATRALQILIQADRDATYRELSPVLTACRDSGATEVALAAELRPGS